MWHNYSWFDKDYLCHIINGMKKPKRGRPKLAKGDRRTETLRVRLTKAEKGAIEKQSDNPSEWARERLLAGVMQ